MITSAQATRADQLINQGRAQESYFFSSLSSPDWIQPLHALGYFKTPPPPEGTGDERTCSRWPELLYLARMAEHAPGLVAGLLCGMARTENYLIHDDQIKVCQSLPPKEAAAVVKNRLKEWSNSSLSFSAPERLAELAKTLGTNGQPGQATAIVTTLVSLEPAPQQDDDDSVYSDRSPVPRVGTRSTYTRMLDAIGAGVGSATASSMIAMCRALGAVLTEVADDTWCEDISQSSSRMYDSRTALLHTITRYGVLLGDSERDSLDPVLSHLSQCEHRIFHRLRYELLARYPDKRRSEIRSVLSDPATIESCGSTYEFRRLITQYFGILEDDEKLPYLEWLAREPDPDRIREFRLFFGLSEPTDDEIRESHEIHLRDELYAVRDELAPKWRQRYEDLVAAHGAANQPRTHAPPQPVARSVADSSPYEATELSAMSIESLIRMLKTWRPTAGARIEEPTIGALSKRLEESVQERSLEISSNAMAFTGLDPSYVSVVLTGLGKCVNNGDPIDVSSLLDLCRWTLGQKDAHKRKGIAHPYEVSWDWVQGHVAEVLQQLLRADPPVLTMTDAPRAWEMIARLCTHPDPPPDQEEDENREYLTLAINSTRGKGLETLFRYVIWLHKVRDESGPSAALEEFETQAWDCLSRCVDPSENRSLADRAIFGRWFPHLSALSEQWTREHVDAIFPLSERHSALLDAAWNSFIVYTHPYSNIFNILQDRYTWAASRLSEIKESHPDSAEHLIQHLMVLYVHGAADLNSNQLTTFWTVASHRLRARALSFVGYTLPSNADDIDDAVVARFRALADSRVQHYEDAPSESEQAVELASLGVWFDNPALEDSWMLITLNRVLRLTSGRLEQKEEVTERLVLLSNDQLPTVVESLDLMVRAKDDRWWIESAAGAVKTILSKGLASSEPKLRDRADALQNFLISAGHWEFRKLE